MFIQYFILPEAKA